MFLYTLRGASITVTQCIGRYNSMCRVLCAILYKLNTVFIGFVAPGRGHTCVGGHRAPSRGRRRNR